MCLLANCVTYNECEAKEVSITWESVKVKSVWTPMKR